MTKDGVEWGLRGEIAVAPDGEYERHRRTTPSGWRLVGIRVLEALMVVVMVVLGVVWFFVWVLNLVAPDGRRGPQPHG